ncbi:MAG: 50S ribosomal protein L10 [Chloroflexota bacterium]
MPTAQKEAAVELLAGKLRESQGAVLLDYRGLNVADITQLRRELQNAEIDFQVAKNTLLGIAATQAGIELEPELLAGPTAIAFTGADVVTPAKLLTEFVKRNRVVSIKGGILGPRSLTAVQIGQFAELPSREVLLGKLLGVLQAPLVKAAGTIQAPAQQVARLAAALAAREQEAAA